MTNQATTIIPAGGEQQLLVGSVAPKWSQRMCARGYPCEKADQVFSRFKLRIIFIGNVQNRVPFLSTTSDKSRGEVWSQHPVQPITSTHSHSTESYPDPDNDLNDGSAMSLFSSPILEPSLPWVR